MWNECCQEFYLSRDDESRRVGAEIGEKETESIHCNPSILLHRLMFVGIHATSSIWVEEVTVGSRQGCHESSHHDETHQLNAFTTITVHGKDSEPVAGDN